MKLLAMWTGRKEKCEMQSCVVHESCQGVIHQARTPLPLQDCAPTHPDSRATPLALLFSQHIIPGSHPRDLDLNGAMLPPFPSNVATCAGLATQQRSSRRPRASDETPPILNLEP